MKRLFIIFAMVTGLCLTGFAAEKEPDAKEILKILIANGSMPLSADPSCKGVGSSPDDRTLADALASFISFQADEGTTASISVKNTKSTAGKAAVWSSDIMFLGRSGEDVYSWGFRLQIKDADRKLVTGSIKCIGGG